MANAKVSNPAKPQAEVPSPNSIPRIEKDTIETCPLTGLPMVSKSLANGKVIGTYVQASN